MADRINEEFELLRSVYPDIQRAMSGQEHWFHIPAYSIPQALGWTPAAMPIAFHAQPKHPGAAPYGIFVPTRVCVHGQAPNNFNANANKAVPFPGRWGVLSWTVQSATWRPKADTRSGSNLLNYALGFIERFQQGR